MKNTNAFGNEMINERKTKEIDTFWKEKKTIGNGKSTTHTHTLLKQNNEMKSDLFHRMFLFIDNKGA